ncbi:tRNA modification GTPase [Pseudoxanthobacter soli DSM 19599]|uniref:tRNA modification GTPase MnmE n=1 Tax=Pseudoxanthobacter soli DSM 19599 TaxID=1123029 RepID=A0A1M7ZJJ2_9HYPH|nr:tRNA uridine-5-carboxymethylaminomethyl(34) synthesis GTPase MnmE [Pseudoxanthobacter soli]SHO64969.1 tRNA modification GTPase [Pseudoxanthobacter soli DSM 19599]
MQTLPSDTVAGDTIVALSSGALPAAVAVVRLSGPNAGPALAALCGGRLPPPRRAVLRRLVRRSDGAPLDRALVLWLPGPGTATGEDMAELHLHGGRAVVAAVIAELASGPAAFARPAEPGEFTRRAFLAGRMDLAAVEGLADLLAAETEAQRVQALAQAGGALSSRIADWRSRLIEARALLEASLDFSDEADVAEVAEQQAIAEAAGLRSALAVALADAGRGERLRDGFQVALMGPPNAGKSSLMNALASREVAIVTAEAGTTRDVIEVHLDLGGYPVTVADTAGLRETAGEAEREGIRRALSRGRDADLVVWLDPPDETALEPPGELGGSLWRIRTKADLEPGHELRSPVEGSSADGAAGVPGRISVSSGEGIGDLVAAIGAAAAQSLKGGEDALVTRARHRAAIEDAVACLDRATMAGFIAPELRAEELRRAGDALGRVVGAVGVEAVLGRIFSSFCIGK